LDVDRLFEDRRAGATVEVARLPLPAYVWRVVDGRLTLIDCNDAAHRLEESVDIFMGLTTDELAEVNPDMVCDLLRALEEQTVVRSERAYRRLVDRHTRWHMTTYVYAPPATVIAHVEDVTERRQAEDALRASEQRYRQIVETTSEGVWMVDEHDRTTFVNGRMAQMLGYTPEEMIGTSPADHRLEAGVPSVRDRLQSCPRGNVRLYETRFRRRDGGTLWASVSYDALPAVDGEYAGGLAMVSDITEHKRAAAEAERLEEALHQAQKLETVGQLAGGVAHDFNNLLGVILNASEFALERLAGHEVADDVRMIQSAAERAAALTRQLLVFSRREIAEPRLVDLNELVSCMEDLIRRTLDEHIELEVALGDGVPAVTADPSHLEQVLLNLVVNARDAMPAGGVLRIETSVAGGDALLSVSDTGTGMTPEVLARAFEPFFTTKPKGTGTGLGLATTYGIVKQNGGQLEFDSEVGRGTVARVLLPRATSAACAHPEEEHAAVQPGRGERILVIEDDAAVRRITERILTASGYDVIAAPDGVAALGLPGLADVDLVVTDVVMPGMPGPQLVDELRRRRPGLPAIFMSGYTDRPGALPAGATFVSKPFARQALLESVATELADSSAAAP
jgi:two-component system, cell cycle sensor histidine kinase and response regulator CckA